MIPNAKPLKFDAMAEPTKLFISNNDNENFAYFHIVGHFMSHTEKVFDIDLVGPKIHDFASPIEITIQITHLSSICPFSFLSMTSLTP